MSIREVLADDKLIKVDAQLHATQAKLGLANQGDKVMAIISVRRQHHLPKEKRYDEERYICDIHTEFATYHSIGPTPEIALRRATVHWIKVNVGPKTTVNTPDGDC